ncbi:MAG: hypothetical protein ACI4GV_08100 [Acutalibacteraceae bacterium]
MPILTSEEEKQIATQKAEMKSTLSKFKSDYLSSLFLGIKVGGVSLAFLVLIYFIAKYIFSWDLFYETDLNYSAIFMLIAAIFFAVVILCIIVAVILFNTKHRRNTKY